MMDKRLGSRYDRTSMFGMRLKLFNCPTSQERVDRGSAFYLFGGEPYSVRGKEDFPEFVIKIERKFRGLVSGDDANSSVNVALNRAIVGYPWRAVAYYVLNMEKELKRPVRRDVLFDLLEAHVQGLQINGEETQGILEMSVGQSAFARVASDALQGMGVGALRRAYKKEMRWAKKHCRLE